MFTTKWSVITKHYKQSQLPPTGTWINLGVYIQWETIEQWKQRADMDIIMDGYDTMLSLKKEITEYVRYSYIYRTVQE